MKYASTEGYMLVHARSEWPCLVCRPASEADRGGDFLCLNCAHDVISTSVSESGREARNWNDIGYALAEVFEQAQQLDCLAVN